MNDGMNPTMSFTVPVTVLLVIFGVQSNVCSDIQRLKYSRLASLYIDSMGVSYQARSAIDCCQTCSQQTDCSSVNYNHHTKVCQLLSVHPTHFGLTVVVPATNWSLYYKIGVCADQWVVYRNSCYLFDMNNRTWDEARDFCSVNDADLLEISDVEENTMAYQNAQSVGLGDYWIGMTDAMDEGNFQWLSGEPVHFTYFDDGEPNGMNGDEDCTGTIWGSSLWNDWICSQSLCTICERNQQFVFS